MWINKRASHVDVTDIEVSWPEQPSINIQITCDQSGLLQIVESESHEVLFYHCTLIAWTTGDKYR